MGIASMADNLSNLTSLVQNFMITFAQSADMQSENKKQKSATVST